MMNSAEQMRLRHHMQPWSVSHLVHTQAVLQWLARQNSSRSQTSAEAGSAADGSSGRRAPALERPLTEKQFVMTHK